MMIGSLLVAAAGGVLLYFGYQFEESNLNTLVNPTLIKAVLLYLGFFLTGIGVLGILASFVRKD